MHLIDTNVAIYLRDGNSEVVERLDRLSRPPAISIMTWAELEGGVYRDPAAAKHRRVSLDALLEYVQILPFDAAVVRKYGTIVAARGFIRSRMVDRLIAATAIVHGMTLITMNGANFRDIPGLELEIWPAPAAQ